MHQRACRDEPDWASFLAKVYGLDAFVAAACLENLDAGWESLFAAPAGREDRLLIDALRQQAARCFPQDVGRQEECLQDFWGHLLVPPRDGSPPILERYDGLRPLIPWLIRVFRNGLISQLRGPHSRDESLPEDDWLPGSDEDGSSHSRWEETFIDAARAWLKQLSDQELLLLGLLFRFRLSQREVAALREIHEGTISRRVRKLREGALTFIATRMQAAGWTGDDLQTYVLRELGHVLLDEPRLSLPALAQLCDRLGVAPPARPDA
jgi:RNA polymerase sigma factor (sigma-70 family)